MYIKCKACSGHAGVMPGRESDTGFFFYFFENIKITIKVCSSSKAKPPGLCICLFILECSNNVSVLLFPIDSIVFFI